MSLAIDFDSVAEMESSGLDPIFSELCARSWVAADSWALFSSLMSNISHWYEWREPTSLPSSSRGPINFKPYVPPIIQTCNNIQGVLLKSVDPVLHDAMQSAGVEPQMYGLYVSGSFCMPSIDAWHKGDGSAYFSRENSRCTKQWCCGMGCLPTHLLFLISCNGHA